MASSASEIPLNLKAEGDLAELMVADGAVINVRCRSHSLTNGKVIRIKHYTAETIDLLAVYDATRIAATTCRRKSSAAVAQLFI